MQHHMPLAVLPSALHCCVLQQLPVHPRQWSIVATSCTELSGVVASERRRTAKAICDEHDLQTIHEAGELLLKLSQTLDCYGDTAEALRLMVAGAPVDWQSKLGRTALHLAAFGGKMELADALIGVGAQLDLQDSSGKTPLIYATMLEHTQLAVVLVDARAHLDLQDSVGSSALLYAIALDYTPIAVVLIQKGAKLQLFDLYG